MTVQRLRNSDAGKGVPASASCHSMSGRCCNHRAPARTRSQDHCGCAVAMFTLRDRHDGIRGIYIDLCARRVVNRPSLVHPMGGNPFGSPRTATRKDKSEWRHRLMAGCANLQAGLECAPRGGLDPSAGVGRCAVGEPERTQPRCHEERESSRARGSPASEMSVVAGLG